MTPAAARRSRSSRRFRTAAVALIGGLITGSLVAAVAGSTGSAASPLVTFTAIGHYETGDAIPADEITAAEIVAYEDATLYVMSAGSLDVIDFADPTSPSKLYELALPGDPTSVAVSHGLVAVSVPATPKTDPGRVLFFRGRTKVGDVVVGALPDMITFTPDGSRLLVANEGEPNSFGQPDSVDPEGSVSVITTQPFRSAGALQRRQSPQPVTTIRFADFDLGGARHAELPAGLRIAEIAESVAQDLEPEYVTVAADGSTAWVSLQENNAIARLDLDELRVAAVAALGTSDHNLPGFGLDASDRDGINIRNLDVQGMYMPDGITDVAIDGTTYVLTANEGDAREYPGYSDIRRGSSQPGLNRLNVTTAPPIADGRTYSFGSRSFSVRTADGALVWDSGDDFEQIVAGTLPLKFNASNSNNTFDNRSDDKGPEPESVVVGEIDGHQLAFVALERIGGVMVYDISDPTAPAFQQYLVTRTFPDPDNGIVGPDAGPEGMVFVAAGDSPTGSPLLVVGNEISGTVNVFGVA